MARGVDFLRLYHEFGLEPDASVDDLKLAYRRRVSALHPDRLNTDPISQHLAGEHLTRLTTLYNAALRFHQQHGRLPGASASARGDITRPRAAAEGPTAPGMAPTEAVDRDTRGHVRWWLLGMLVLGVLVWSIARLAELEDAIAPEPPPEPLRTASPAPAPAAPRTAGIRLGMRADDVMHVQGEPVARSEDRWDYGPSWIRFEDGRVAEWYSSPLRALRIDRSPAPAERDAGAAED